MWAIQKGTWSHSDCGDVAEGLLWRWWWGSWDEDWVPKEGTVPIEAFAIDEVGLWGANIQSCTCLGSLTPLVEWSAQRDL